MTLKRSGLRGRPRNTGPTAEVVQAVWDRDFGGCAYCARPISGERGIDYSVHHRMARKRGGTNRPHINMPGNLVLLHGHGAGGCHFRVETEGLWSREHGFKVREGRWLPTEVGIEHAVHGHCYLLDDGSISYEPPVREDVG